MRSEFSLIYPSDRPRQTDFCQWGENSISDLGLKHLFSALSYEPKYEGAVRDIVLELSSDTAVISYRQDILEDFLNNPSLAAQIKTILPLLAKLHDYSETRSRSGEETVHQMLGRLTELKTYLDCVEKLKQILLDHEEKIQSRGLKDLLTLLQSIEAEKTFQSLSETLPELISRLSGIPSITIGINLDYELRPVGAMLLSVNEKPFVEGSLLDKITGRGKNGKDNQGVGPLHEVPFEQVEALDGRIVPLSTRVDPLMVPLFQDVYKVLRSVLSPISASLRQFTQVHAEVLLPLEHEIAFYLGAVSLIDKLRDGNLPVCRPEILPMEDRTSQMTDMYNLILALHRINGHDEETQDMPVILNNLDFGPDGRIFILTGPNQGGKTVFTQAVGLAHLLFQAGLFVPAENASLSPVDCIYTHFAAEEKSDSRFGRLSEESIRLNEIFQTLTQHSLVLLNESLSSTSAHESLYLARDIVRALRLFEARAIFATHLHELAENLADFNDEGSSDSLVVSLVAGVELDDDLPEPEERVVPRTYQIKPGPPRGVSYAKGIAHRFGISFEQLSSLRQDKGEKII